MYTKYFGFNEKPFTLTPNPRFIFLSRNHKEAFAHLLYGINNHYGFIALIGEVGTGKTTVLRTLLGQLQDDCYRSALILNPCVTGIELLRSINNEFDIDSSHGSANELLAELNLFLMAENARGRTVVLVIDEAQTLQPGVLEQVRLISNLETEDDKLIQIILSGQPELESTLERPDLRQLNQRIAVRYRLRFLSMDETSAYIRHRMKVAGETGGVSFSRTAIRWIYFYARGIPRMINIICDRSLLIAYGDERRRISTRIVIRAIREIRNVAQGRRISPAVIGSGAILGIILTLGVIHWLPARFQGPHKVSSETAPARATTSQTAPPTFIPASTAAPRPAGGTNVQHVSNLDREIRSLNQNEAHIQAFNAIVARWKRRPITLFKGQLTIPTMFVRLAQKRNLQLTTYNGSLDNVLRFDLPFLAVTKIAGDLGDYCVAVTSAENGTVTIFPALGGSSTIRKDDLDAVATGTFHIVWDNSEKIPDVITAIKPAYKIRALQQLLRQSGFYHGAIDGTYSAETISAVSDFQHSLGIPANDSVGELTLAALSRFARGHTVPSLKTN